eukprot:m.397896 g.397896  ORF g.397896 m.397896 type:complete len:140 (-) comp16773_c2_seq40:4224-4643(-)
MAYDKKKLEEAFALYQEFPDKLPAHRVGEVLRCAGANPTTEEVNAVIAGGTHVSTAQMHAGMSKQKIGGDVAGDLRECLSIFDSLGEGLIEAGEFRGVMANLGDSFNHEEIGQLMLMCDLNADNKFAIDDIVAFGQKYS